jgi:very-short-patch-repair endonuclease
MVKNNQIHGFRFRRRHKIGQFIIDFYCHKVNLVVEVDGGIHEKGSTEDQLRTDFLKRLGLTVLRFTNNELLDSPDKVKQQIENHIQKLSAQFRDQ